MSDPIEEAQGVAAPLPLANVDTDMIIPARFMKTLTREGLGRGLFHGLRFDDCGHERPGFILNREGYRSAKVIVALNNFGCGSSREHAPWALLDFGIRCLIAPSFSDIFAANCSRNGLLLVTLPRHRCEELMEAAAAAPVVWTINLAQQSISRPDQEALSFAIDPSLKKTLLAGADEIRSTLEHSGAITSREARVRGERWWLATTAGLGEQGS